MFKNKNSITLLNLFEMMPIEEFCTVLKWNVLLYIFYIMMIKLNKVVPNNRNPHKYPFYINLHTLLHICILSMHKAMCSSNKHFEGKLLI